ncbi:hypothetical protein FJT64_004750 [Amphibalanus amphitrite]|uniref:Apple domain-containing protein n=1 Tax=Amphibalanus amphitrite TaxID=1232801 RepID=A0A6A4W774_AMPAM|nr:hypothetical protein FJT64_004750 [Amphibalanus amphitrite]
MGRLRVTRLSLPVALVLCGVLLHIPPSTKACQETAWTNGYLSAGTAMEAFTLRPGRGSACACCSFCNSNANCASLNYNIKSRECLLFNYVANYTSITASSDWRYFVMPGRSQHEQFCREDSDCLQSGDSCRGRVCTDLSAITCRVIYEQLGSGDRLGGEILAYGWMNGKDVRLICRMTAEWPGFTSIFRNRKSSTSITRDNVRSYNADLSAGTEVQAGLEMADLMRQLHSEGQYQLRTIAKCSNSPAFDGELVTEARLDRGQPVFVEVSDATAAGDTSQTDVASITSVSLPYLLPSEEDIVSVKINVELEGAAVGQVAMPLARTDRWLSFESVAVFIRE